MQLPCSRLSRHQVQAHLGYPDQPRDQEFSQENPCAGANNSDCMRDLLFQRHNEGWRPAQQVQ